MEETILSRLTTLGHRQRMAVLRLLVRRHPDGVPAGEIGEALGIKPSTLSVYLSALKTAGLTESERQGTSLLYRARIGALHEVMDYLLMDCCRGRPDMCSTTNTTLPTNRKLNALFICSANSARSIFAEAILRREAGQRFNVYSAGTNPGPGLNAVAVAMLKDKGYDTSDLQSQGLDAFQGTDAPVMDFVFTVCDQAANEECPAWQGQPISAHWGVPDPVKAEGTDAEKRLAFQNAYCALRNRILTFSALPFDTLDRASLQNRVDELS
ncbi:MAG: helix-turn-helix domain-containing protein [Rhodobacteraceae bacterium]|nr:helix-turn-helix domain-containing protein [Paracoccaceae bacterium]